MGDRILRLPKVEDKTGLKKTAIYERLNPKSKYYDPTFPRPVSLGARAVGFSELAVNAWVDARIASSHPVVTS